MFYNSILQIIDGVKTHDGGKYAFHGEQRYTFSFKMRKEEPKKLNCKVYIFKSVSYF